MEVEWVGLCSSQRIVVDRGARRGELAHVMEMNPTANAVSVEQRPPGQVHGGTVQADGKRGLLIFCQVNAGLPLLSEPLERRMLRPFACCLLAVQYYCVSTGASLRQQ